MEALADLTRRLADLPDDDEDADELRRGGQGYDGVCRRHLAPAAAIRSVLPRATRGIRLRAIRRFGDDPVHLPSDSKAGFAGLVLFLIDERHPTRAPLIVDRLRVVRRVEGDGPWTPGYFDDPVPEGRRARLDSVSKRIESL
jgi:hypothetical protein